jgi:hypothetical protein
MYENARGEALQSVEPPSWALERVGQYGVAGLLPGSQKDFPFILYTQSVPRPAWSGKRDLHRERLHQVYEFLIQEVTEDARNTSRSLCAGRLHDTADEASDGVPA